MTILLNLCRALAAVLLALSTGAVAGPGEHGPGGEHLDTPGAQSAGGSMRPRIETKSELFELVGYLHESELSVMINRFETNEPVLNASVEIATGTSKALAKFHSEHGDYAVDDPGFLKLVAASGEHPLIFTIVAGNDSDLLEGTLKVATAQGEAHADGHSHWLEYLLIGAAVAALLAVVLLWRRRARLRLRYAAGGVS